MRTTFTSDYEDKILGTFSFNEILSIIDSVYTLTPNCSSFSLIYKGSHIRSLSTFDSEGTPKQQNWMIYCSNQHGTKLWSIDAEYWSTHDRVYDKTVNMRIATSAFGSQFRTEVIRLKCKWISVTQNPVGNDLLDFLNTIDGSDILTTVENSLVWLDSGFHVNVECKTCGKSIELRESLRSQVRGFGSYTEAAKKMRCERCGALGSAWFSVVLE